MAIVKRAATLLVASAETLGELEGWEWPARSSYEVFRKRAGGLDPIKLYPDKFIYLRNRSVSSLEQYGPNQNGDGFPRGELQTRYATFIGCPVVVDHRDFVKVGMVISSEFIEPIFSEGGKFITGDFVENVLAVEKSVVASFEKAGVIPEGFCDKILAGKVTDTSMGCLTEWTECSICANKAYDESEYCFHIRNQKCSLVRVGAEEPKHVHEICRKVTFFQDSIIVPASMGGLAGGAGADPDAKMLERVAGIETAFDDYLVDRRKQRMAQYPHTPDTTKIINPTESKETVTIGKKPKKVEEKEREKEEEEKRPDIVVKKKSQMFGEEADFGPALDYLIELVGQGKTMEEALEVTEAAFNGNKEAMILPDGQRVVNVEKIDEPDMFLVKTSSGAELVVSRDELKKPEL